MAILNKSNIGSFAILEKFFQKALPAFFVSMVGVEANAFDVKSAEKTFKKCRSCHEIGENASSKVGPHLNGLANKQIASEEGFKYSKSFKQAAEEGVVWNEESLHEFLKKPRAFIKGTKMSFAGLRKEEDRNNLIGWLLHFDANGKELSNKVNFESNNKNLLGTSAAALTGDPEYGEYLSGECVTCHKPNGTDEGIPSIVGWPKEHFIDALYQYKNDLRKNPVMRTVTRRLGDEEMAALAAYYSSLPQE